jgi:hypothetical protein
MVNINTRTTDPALAFHIQHYLDANTAQRKLAPEFRQYMELDQKREAAMTNIAIHLGLIKEVPSEGFLPPEIWNAALEVVYTNTQPHYSPLFHPETP